MIGLFADIKKAFKFDEVKTDNLTFRIFYKGSMLLHFFFIILIGAKQFFGDPIDCHMRSKEVKRDFFNTHCWIHGTFTRRQFLVPEGDLTDNHVINQGMYFSKKNSSNQLIRYFYFGDFLISLILSKPIKMFQNLNNRLPWFAQSFYDIDLTSFLFVIKELELPTIILRNLMKKTRSTIPIINGFPSFCFAMEQ